jgi:hypothetical protein
MSSGKQGIIHALEFGCQAPLKFYEHCIACPHFNEDCTDLIQGIEILRGKKKLVYNEKDQGEGMIHAHSFKCIAPLRYFEKSRKNCGHEGRCREEGLLIALLSGKKELVYTRKVPVEFPAIQRRVREARTEDAMTQSD